MVKNYWRQICFAPDGASGGDTTSQNTADASATKEGEDNSDISLSIEESQGLEAIDESFLMGHDPEAEAKKADTSKADDTKKADDKAKADAVAAEAKAKDNAADSQSKDAKDDKSSAESKTASSESKDDDSKTSGKDDDAKPPKGYVPLAAVQEVRGENKYLKERIKELEAKADKPPSPAPKEETKKESALPKDFKVLSDDEFAKLADEDPKDALLYMKNLGVYQEEQRQEVFAKQQQRLDERDKAESEKETQAIFDATSKKMEELVPGIFDKDSDAAEELAKFADELGFSEDMYYLTNPETMIILPGETEPLLLGEQAASVIQTLATARKTINEFKEKSVDEAKLREDIEKEVEAKLRKDIEAELLAKFKKGLTEETFQSIDEIPSTETAEFGDKVLSMVDFNKLSEAEQEAYLSGA